MTALEKDYLPALAVRLDLKGGSKAWLYRRGAYGDVSKAQGNGRFAEFEIAGFAGGCAYAPLGNEQAALRVCPGNPAAPIRIVETQRLIVRVEGGSEGALPTLRNEQKVKPERDKDLLEFKFVNYIGRTHLTFKGGEDLVLEVVPSKMGYDEDYRLLNEGIASHCAELLLDLASPTASLFRKGLESRPRTLLGQFIFLRQLASPGAVEGIFEAIRRNPDRKLIRRREMVPFGTAAPSPKIFTAPLSHSRDWHKLQIGGGTAFVPAFYEADRKDDSNDTEANRFVKFALGVFKAICKGVAGENDDGTTAKGRDISQSQHEALDLKQRIELIEDSPFFRCVGQMRVMPTGNQVLQKRSGYDRVLQILALCTIAPALNWDGEAQAFEGESRNIALLYEYWLFFELSEIMGSLPGCSRLKDADHEGSIDAVKIAGNGSVAISLKQGVLSRQAFVIKRHGAVDLALDLYYNRTFKHHDFEGTRYDGSYSTIFRPDFTISIYPRLKGGEAEAVRRGNVVFLHFDAKYRLDRGSIFGGSDALEPDKDESESEEGNLSCSEQENEYLEEENAESVERVYRRGDLLKMHTYRDAIRRTVGSYILYPWTPPPKRDGKDASLGTTFRVYSEIIPGVGAFAYSPANRTAARKVLSDFISDVISIAGRSISS